MVENSPTERDDAQTPAPVVLPPTSVAAMAAAPTARRRLLRTGLVGGPVALLTAGKPVKTLASTWCNMSGFNSVNLAKKKSSKTGKKKSTLSHTPPTGTCSTGLGPSSWIKTSGGKTVPNDWPSKFNSASINTGSSTTTKFSALFPIPSTSPNMLQGDTLLKILTSYSGTVEAYIIAAAFSSVSTRVSGFISASEVVTIWEEWANNNTDGSTTNAMALLSFLEQLV
jgi:hypothetical protein